jgi:mannose-6-phosphate isomerase-like protein (cupin superfamily)
MKKMTRREMCAGLPALAAITSVAQDQTAATPNVLTQARAYTLDQIPPRKMANGGLSRDVLRGALPTGEIINVHESEQPAGATPNPAHTIQHTEVIVIIQGTVVFEHDGKSEKAGPGDILYVAKDTLHQLRNTGQDTAKYCVVQIGGDTRK